MSKYRRLREIAQENPEGYREVLDAAEHAGLWVAEPLERAWEAATLGGDCI